MKRVDSSFLPFMDLLSCEDESHHSDTQLHISSSHSQLPTSSLHNSSNRVISPSFGKPSHMVVL